jgi:hypothetical protein
VIPAILRLEVIAQPSKPPCVNAPLDRPHVLHLVPPNAIFRCGWSGDIGWPQENAGVYRVKDLIGGTVQGAAYSGIGRSISQIDQQDWCSFRPVDLSRAIVLRRDLVVDGAPCGRVISLGKLEADGRGAILGKRGLGPWLQGVNLRHG